MFSSDNEEHRYHDKFLLWMKRLRRHKGGYYICELWNCKGKSIHATQLYTLEQGAAYKYVDDDPDVIDLPQWHQPHYQVPVRPVELSDHQAISDTKKAIIAFALSLKDARDNNDLGRAADLQEEKEKAEQYLRDVLDYKGGIKKTGDLAREHCQLVSHAVSGFIKALQVEAPELAAYLRQHVVIGRLCYWSENPKSRSKKGGINVHAIETNYPGGDNDREAV
jgi:hypothetical protein